MTNKSGRTMQRTNNLRDELIGAKGWCVIAPVEQYSGSIYFQ